MSSEATLLLPKKNLMIFLKTYWKFAQTLSLKNYEIEKFSDKKKAIIINHFLDKLIKKHKNMMFH